MVQSRAHMKRRIFSLLCITLVTIVGVMLYQYAAFSRIRADLDEQSKAIADAYTALIDEDVDAIREKFELTAVQERMVSRLEETADTLTTSDVSVEMRVQAIGSIQATLHQFSSSFEATEEIQRDPHYGHLQQSIGETGDVKELLQTFNTTAARWNNGIQSEIGSILGRVDGSDRQILPYLRFDGGSEFVPVISL